MLFKYHLFQIGPYIKWRRYAIVVASWSGRLVSLAVQLLLLPLLLKILGDQKFSVYQIILSLQGWIMLCSLGIGPALKNLISEMVAKGEPEHEVRYATTFFLWLLFIIFVVSLVVLSPLISNSILGRLTEGERWAGTPMSIALLLMLVISMGQVGAEALYAEMRAHWVYLLPAIAQSLGLLFIYGFEHIVIHAQDILFWVVIFWFGPQALTGIIQLRMTKLLRVPRSLPELPAMRALYRLAPKFFVFALFSNAVLLVDYLVMSQTLNPSDIVLYAAMMRVVGLFLTFYMAFLLIIWPEWTKQMSKGEWLQTSRRILKLGIAGVFFCVMAGVLLLGLLEPVMRGWLDRPHFVVSPVTILLFFGYLGVRVWTDTHAVALLSINRVEPLIATVIVQLLITVPAEFLFGNIWGANGIVLGLIIGFLLTASWSLPYQFHSHVRQMAQK